MFAGALALPHCLVATLLLRLIRGVNGKKKKQTCRWINWLLRFLVPLPFFPDIDSLPMRGRQLDVFVDDGRKSERFGMTDFHFILNESM